MGRRMTASTKRAPLTEEQALHLGDLEIILADNATARFGEPRIVWGADVRAVPFQRTRLAAGGRHFTPTREREFREELQLRWRAAKLRRVPGPLLVAIHVTGTGTRGDIDNYAKGIIDAGNGILWHDDRAIEALYATFGWWGTGRRRVELRVWEVR